MFELTGGSSRKIEKVFNKELHKFYSSLNIIRVNKRWRI
jgi:hypothetical protein